MQQRSNKGATRSKTRTKTRTRGPFLLLNQTCWCSFPCLRENLPLIKIFIVILCSNPSVQFAIGVALTQTIILALKAICVFILFCVFGFLFFFNFCNLHFPPATITITLALKTILSAASPGLDSKQGLEKGHSKRNLFFL